MLNEYIGIIGAVAGAVAGSVSTLLASEGIRRIGRLKFYLKNIRIRYILNQNFENKLYETERQPFRLGYDLEIYNSGNIPRIVHDFRLVFYKRGAIVFENPPKCDTPALSIHPREIISISQMFDLDDRDDLLVGVNKIILKYRTGKNRYKKYVIYEGQPIMPETEN